jgi:hypothetical protein
MYKQRTLHCERCARHALGLGGTGGAASCTLITTFANLVQKLAELTHAMLAKYEEKLL